MITKAIKPDYILKKNNELFDAVLFKYGKDVATKKAIGEGKKIWHNNTIKDFKPKKDFYKFLGLINEIRGTYGIRD